MWLFQPADSLNFWLALKAALTWFLWTWNSKVFVSMLMLDKFPNGNLENEVRQDYYQSKVQEYGTIMCRVLWRLFTCQPVFQKTLRGWATEPKGELGHRRGRRQDSAKSPPHPAEKQKDFPITRISKTQLWKHLKASCMCYWTCRKKKGIVSTHRGTVCVGQRECNSLWWVDQWGPGQVRCYLSLHVFLQVCVHFKDGLNPLTREYTSSYTL